MAEERIVHPERSAGVGVVRRSLSETGERHLPQISQQNSPVPELTGACDITCMYASYPIFLLDHPSAKLPESQDTAGLWRSW